MVALGALVGRGVGNGKQPPSGHAGSGVDVGPGLGRGVGMGPHPSGGQFGSGVAVGPPSGRGVGYGKSGVLVGGGIVCPAAGAVGSATRATANTTTNAATIKAKRMGVLLWLTCGKTPQPS